MQKLLLPLLLVGTALALPPQEDGRYLKDRDLGKLATALGAFVDAANAREGMLEAEQAVQAEMDKLAKKLKKAPTQDVLGLPSDLGQALHMSRNYAKAKGVKKGKVQETEYEEFGAILGDPSQGGLEYAVWAPSKYDPKKSSYTLFLSIGAADETPHQHITEQWTEGTIREAAVIATPKMPKDVEKWGQREGLARVLILMRAITEKYAVDADRIYLCGRGPNGVAAALSIASQFPDRFAGVIGRAGDVAEGASAKNFGALPVWLSGAGSHAAAFQAEAKELGWEENVTLDPEGREPEFWIWAQNNPRQSLPTTVTLYPGNPFPSRIAWLKSAGGFAEGARVTATVDRENNTITIDGDKVTDVVLHLNDDLVDLSRPVKVIANGQEHVDQIPRSFRTCLELVRSATSDPKRVFVATMNYTLPAKPE